MADIFLSYSSKDATRAKKVREALARAGYAVWSMQDVPGTQNYAKIIQQELDSCSCMVVLWSRNSVKSDWVMSEAELGRRRGILIAGRLDNVDPLPPFLFTQAADLFDKRGTTFEGRFKVLQSLVSDFCGLPVPERRNLIAKEQYGGYTLNNNLLIIGNFFGYRRSLSRPGVIVRSLFTIDWNKKEECLAFNELQKFKQSGRIHISQDFPILHFVSWGKGLVRLITLSKIKDHQEDRTMRGVVLTQREVDSVFAPALSPYLMQRAEGRLETLKSMIGSVVRGDREYEGLVRQLAETEKSAMYYARGGDPKLGQSNGHRSRLRSRTQQPHSHRKVGPKSAVPAA